MKKLLLTVLCMLMCLSGCAENIAKATSTVSVPDTTHVLSSLEEQAALLFHQRSVWEQKDISELEPFYYTITDLDHNGRLEVIAAITSGTGMFTWGAFCEVSENLQSVTRYTPVEGMDLPEIIVDKTQCYFDPRSGTYYYAFFNTTRNGGAESWTSKVLLSAVQGGLDIKSLGWKHLLSDWENGEHTEYENAEGTIPQEAYENAFERAGEGMQVSTVRFDWVNAKALDSADAIYANYQVFAGERKLVRPAQADLQYYSEGGVEFKPANLVTMEDYSLYIPAEGWQQRGEQLAGERFVVWQSTANSDVCLKIGKLGGMDSVAAGVWVRQQFSDYTLDAHEEYLWGDTRTGKRVNVQILAEDSGTYVVISSYPTEVEIGMPMLLNTVAGTLKID